jgi:hypothetical protein
MSTFLDTNVLLRHLLNDDPVQSPACFALIARRWVAPIHPAISGADRPAIDIPGS